MESDRSRGLPIWLWGVLAGLALILLSSRGHLAPGNEALSQSFAAQPPQAGALPSLPDLGVGSLPPALQEAARRLSQQLGAGAIGAPIESLTQTARLRVEVRELRPAEGGLQVSGSVTNIGTADLQVPISAFELRDSAGASYVAGGGASASLRPGESTPLELTVPLPPGRGLLLITSLPPDPPTQQRLVADAP